MFVITYVIVECQLVKFWVEDQFFHLELLLTLRVCFIGCSLSQVYRQPLEISMSTDENNNHKWLLHLAHMCEYIFHTQMSHFAISAS